MIAQLRFKSANDALHPIGVQFFCLLWLIHLIHATKRQHRQVVVLRDLLPGSTLNTPTTRYRYLRDATTRQCVRNLHIIMDLTWYIAPLPAYVSYTTTARKGLFIISHSMTFHTAQLGTPRHVLDSSSTAARRTGRQLRQSRNIVSNRGNGIGNRGHGDHVLDHDLTNVHEDDIDPSIRH